MDDKDPHGHPRIPFRGLYDSKHCDLRKKWAENFSSCNLEHTGEWWTKQGENSSPTCLKGNIENPIGLAKIPVGLVGPLLIRGEHINGYVVAPFATTEGALVASCTRGATAIMRANGVCVRIVQQCVIRAPSFKFRSMKDAQLFWNWLSRKIDQMKEIVATFSQHAKLMELQPLHLGRTLVVSFLYSTQDAAGQNMVTSSTWHVCKWVLKHIEFELPNVKIVHFWIESLHSGDKRVAALGLYRPRGHHVVAEAWIPESVLRAVLKVDVDSMLECFEMFRSASVMSASVGFTVNIANVLTGIFLATGQDAAAIEGSTAQLMVERCSEEDVITHGGMLQCKEDCSGEGAGGIYACMVIPNMVVGSVGGGTSLPTQRECLQLMGCFGKDGVSRLAEIIAGFALSLDLSTLAAIANGQFATAHERLGRNRPTHGLKSNHLNSDFFAAATGAKGKLLTWEPFAVNTGNSILSELTKTEFSKMVGHFGFKIKYSDELGHANTLNVVLKSKPSDSETSNMINKVAQSAGLNLAVQYQKHKMDAAGLRHSHVREVELYRLDGLKPFIPEIYHTVCEPSVDLYLIVMEYLDSTHCRLLNTADDISVWSVNDIKVVLRDLAKVHSLYLGKMDWLNAQPWLEQRKTLSMVSMGDLWSELLKHSHAEFPEFWTDERVAIVNSAIKNLSVFWPVVESAPMTLSHNDCNPRNICLRIPKLLQDVNASVPPSKPGAVFTPFDDPSTMCIYDWELATTDVPQHDVAEFLAFVLEPSVGLQVRLELIEFYRQHLQYFSGQDYPFDRFMEIFNFASLEFALNRLTQYTMLHTFKDYSFLPRVVSSNFTYIMAQVAAGAFPAYISTTNSKL